LEKNNVSIMVKTCSKCFIEKDELLFPLTQHGKPRRECKSCRSKYRLENRAKNYQRDLEYQRKWIDDNRDYCNERANKWRKNNPDKVRLTNKAMIAKRRSSVGKHTAKEIEGILYGQNYRCMYCKSCIEDSHHLDHIIPVSKGGSSWSVNMQALCQSCNRRKWASNPTVYEDSIGFNRGVTIKGNFLYVLTFNKGVSSWLRADITKAEAW
jgi:5-methylcytosine-specific restriction endonuclease McrA